MASSLGLPATRFTLHTVPGWSSRSTAVKHSSLQAQITQKCPAVWKIKYKPQKASTICPNFLSLPPFLPSIHRIFIKLPLSAKCHSRHFSFYSLLVLLRHYRSKPNWTIYHPSIPNIPSGYSLPLSERAFPSTPPSSYPSGPAQKPPLQHSHFRSLQLEWLSPLFPKGLCLWFAFCQVLWLLMHISLVLQDWVSKAGNQSWEALGHRASPPPNVLSIYRVGGQ